MLTFLPISRQLFALLWIAMALNACAEPVNEAKKVDVQSVIAAQIGDTWDEVGRNSTFNLERLPTPAGTIIDKAHTFIYRDPRHHMRLENVGYVGISLNYETGRILDFGIAPYREAAGVDQTWQRLQDIILKMEQSAWLPDNDRNGRNPTSQSASELRAKYMNLRSGARGVQRFWFDEYGNEAWVSLVKVLKEAPVDEELRFNVVLQIQVATHPRRPRVPG